MRAWVYKVNSRKPGGGRDWHFTRFFRTRSRRPYSMGGPGRIRSPQSWQRLQRVRRGDLFVCYQTDERKIYGFARTAGHGQESVPGSGRWDKVDFLPPGLRLRNPVPVQHADCRTVFQHIGAFTVPSRGTIHALAADEFRALVRAVVEWNPKQAREVRAFVNRRG